MRTVKQLLNLDGRVYVYLSSKFVAQVFLKNAQAEGFRFRDGKKPTRRKWDDIYALNHNFTLNYVGWIGHIAFYHPEMPSNEKLIRVDYSAYISGSDNYIIDNPKKQNK